MLIAARAQTRAAALPLFDRLQVQLVDLRSATVIAVLMTIFISIDPVGGKLNYITAMFYPPQLTMGVQPQAS